MDIDHTIRCQHCQLGFETEEGLSSHSCIKVKIEKHESEYDDSMLYDNSSILELSEEFINHILQLTDNLCEAIRNGDPSLERTTEVNENLTKAVRCYRDK